MIRLRSCDLSPKGQEILQFFQTRVVGQEPAINKIARAMEIAEAGFGRKNRPLLSLLFLGPSGVGKSLIPSILAEFRFKNRSAYTRLNCPDFVESHAIATAQGSPPGYAGFLDTDHHDEEEIWQNSYPLLSQWNIDKHEFNYLYRDSLNGLERKMGEMVDQLELARAAAREIKKTKGKDGDDYKKALQIIRDLKKNVEEIKDEMVIYHPQLQSYQSIVTFDEIEKGSIELRNIFLSIAESGTLDLKDGQTTRFYNSTIFCTSNTGSEQITKMLSGKGFGFYKEIETDDLDPQLYEQIQKTAMAEAEKFFTAEFLNRFDAVIVFAPLFRKHFEKIFDLEFNYLLNDLRDASFPLAIEVTREVKDYVIDQATKKPEYGARELKRKLEQNIREPLAILKNAGQIAKDDKVTINLEDGKPVFYKDSGSVATTADIK